MNTPTREELIKQAEDQLRRIEEINQKAFGPDDPHKGFFSRLWDEMRGGTDRALKVKKIAHEVGLNPDLLPDAKVSNIIKKHDVRFLLKAYQNSDNKYQKIVLMTAMLQFVDWVPRYILISHLDDDLQDRDMAHHARFILDYFSQSQPKATLVNTLTPQQLAILDRARAILLLDNEADDFDEKLNALLIKS